MWVYEHWHNDPAEMQKYIYKTRNRTICIRVKGQSLSKGDLMQSIYVLNWLILNFIDVGRLKRKADNGGNWTRNVNGEENTLRHLVHNHEQRVVFASFPLLPYLPPLQAFAPKLGAIKTTLAILCGVSEWLSQYKLLFFTLALFHHRRKKGKQSWP